MTYQRNSDESGEFFVIDGDKVYLCAEEEETNDEIRSVIARICSTDAECERVAAIVDAVLDTGVDVPLVTLIDAALANPDRLAGELMFWEFNSRRREEAMHSLEGWPECECCGCGCSDPATTTDDGSNPSCDACEEYAVDDDGNVHCLNCDDVEVVVESCGAGGQTRSYVRMKPPDEPEEDPDGEWACYWDTALLRESRVVSRHTTREEAEQACRAKDWPRPGDHTQYLCGYVVRHLVGDEGGDVEA